MGAFRPVAFSSKEPKGLTAKQRKTLKKDNCAPSGDTSPDPQTRQEKSAPHP